MNDPMDRLPILKEDKANHFIYGQAIFIICMVLLGSPFWGLFWCVLFGAAKEAYDWWHPAHEADWWDFIWTALGGAAGLAIVLLDSYHPFY